MHACDDTSAEHVSLEAWVAPPRGLKHCPAECVRLGPTLKQLHLVLHSLDFRCFVFNDLFQLLLSHLQLLAAAALAAAHIRQSLQQSSPAMVYKESLKPC